MLTQDQLHQLTKKMQTNTTVIAREYLQVWFLNLLYSHPQSNAIFFKGGTALRILFAAERFSEDLDFTVQGLEAKFEQQIQVVFNQAKKEENLTIKPKQTITGKTYLLTAAPAILPFKLFIRLDFSFRENVLDPQKTPLKTTFPIVPRAYIHHLSKHEIFAEKIRAVMTREKGRDLYDLWFLVTQQAQVKPDIIAQKLTYYQMEYDKQALLERIQQFPSTQFVQDLKPFVSIPERDKLPERLVFIKDYLTQYL